VHFTSVFIDASDAGDIASDAVQGYLRCRAPARAAGAGGLGHGSTASQRGYDTLTSSASRCAGGREATRYLPELVIDHLLAHDPAFRARYLREAERLLNHVFTPERWAAMLDEVERHETMRDAPRAEDERSAASGAAGDTPFARARAVFERRPAELRASSRASSSWRGRGGGARNPRPRRVESTAIVRAPSPAGTSRAPRRAMHVPLDALRASPLPRRRRARDVGGWSFPCARTPHGGGVRGVLEVEKLSGSSRDA
jgi:hypothetical protein